ncbi:MAG: hypothetical protein KUG73_14630 [Pseudomonadales bacterium]|nr:hypothetical protein [Pseudomonadales bacterium]
MSIKTMIEKENSMIISHWNMALRIAFLLLNVATVSYVVLSLYSYYGDKDIGRALIVYTLIIDAYCLLVLWRSKLRSKNLPAQFGFALILGIPLSFSLYCYIYDAHTDFLSVSLEIEDLSKSELDYINYRLFNDEGRISDGLLINHYYPEDGGSLFKALVTNDKTTERISSFLTSRYLQQNQVPQLYARKIDINGDLEALNGEVSRSYPLEYLAFAAVEESSEVDGQCIKNVIVSAEFPLVGENGVIIHKYDGDSLVLKVTDFELPKWVDIVVGSVCRTCIAYSFSLDIFRKKANLTTSELRNCRDINFDKNWNLKFGAISWLGLNGVNKNQLGTHLNIKWDVNFKGWKYVLAAPVRALERSRY